MGVEQISENCDDDDNRDIDMRRRHTTATALMAMVMIMIMRRRRMGSGMNCLYRNNESEYVCVFVCAVCMLYESAFFSLSTFSV